MLFTWIMYATIYPHMIAASMSLDTAFYSLCVLLSCDFCDNAYFKFCFVCVRLSKLCEKCYVDEYLIKANQDSFGKTVALGLAKPQSDELSLVSSSNLPLGTDQSPVRSTQHSGEPKSMHQIRVRSRRSKSATPRMRSFHSKSVTIHSLNPSIVTTISLKSDFITSDETTMVICDDKYAKYVHDHELFYNITFNPHTFKQSMEKTQFDHDNLNINRKQHMFRFWCIEDEKDSLIGEGASSKVYKAIDINCIHKDKSKSLFVAIKIIDNSNKSKSSLDKTQWFAKNEIECIGKLSHSNVIKMMAYDLKATFNGKDAIAFVLEYAPNGHLGKLVKKLNGLPENIARAYFHQIISAISACHAAGVVHRDLKLNNIVLDSNYNAKICDFGLAKVKYHSSCLNFCFFILFCFIWQNFAGNQRFIHQGSR